MVESTPAPDTEKPLALSGRPRLPWWKKSLLSLLATVLFVVLLETVLAVFGVKPVNHSEDPFVGFHLFAVSIATDSRMTISANHNGSWLMPWKNFPGPTGQVH